jgi:ABC-2 type transport system ATP-binding protein
MNAIVKVEHLAKRFGRLPVLTDVSFELPAHGVTVLLGANGEGKSTLLKLLLGLLEPSAGRIEVLGLDPLRQPRALREQVAFVPDAPDNPSWMTPEELFRFLRPQYPLWRHERALALAKEWDVPLTRPFKHLSRGQAARALLASALAQAPKLLLLDECFAGLDPVARRDLLGAFLGELAREEVATLLVTHDLDVAARVAERVLVLADGKILHQGSLDEVLKVDEESARVQSRLLGLLERAQQKESAA